VSIRRQKIDERPPIKQSQKIINLTVAMRQRQWFEGLWDKSKAFTLLVKFAPIFSP